MIQQVFYTLLIMSFLGSLLFFGLYAPPAGKKLVQSIANFLHWSPPKQEGPLSETEAAIKEFDSSFKTIRNLRSLVVTRNKQNTEELEAAYKDMRENLQQLLFEMDKQTVTNRTQLLSRFNDLHQLRQRLVQNIIDDERTLINLNDQMDRELRSISAWLSEKAADPSSRTKDEFTRGQQYENLLNDLKSFVNESNQLDVLRIVLMRKSTEFVDRLDETNKKLEESFTKFSAQLEIATADQADTLWAEYQRLEAEQREIVAGMKLNQDFIGENQMKLAAGISTIGQNIRYRSEDQMERFQQNYAQLEAKRAAALHSIQQQQQAIADSRPTIDALKESNEYRMQRVKEQTQQMLTQYEQLEDYRRSLTSTLESMTQELRDNDQIFSRQMEDMRSRLEQRANTNRSAYQGNISDVSQRIDDAMTRNMEQMEMMRARMESAQDRLSNYVEKETEPIVNSPYYIRIKELRERNKSTLELMRRGEDQLRNAQERQRSSVSVLQDRLGLSKGKMEQMRIAQENQKAAAAAMKDRTSNNLKKGGERLDSNDQDQNDDVEALQQRIEDVSQRNSDAAESLKERNESQMQSQKDRIDSQMQRLKDMQQNRRDY
jgi:hypothetical protein